MKTERSRLCFIWIVVAVLAMQIATLTMDFWGVLNKWPAWARIVAIIVGYGAPFFVGAWLTGKASGGNTNTGTDNETSLGEVPEFSDGDQEFSDN